MDVPKKCKGCKHSKFSHKDSRGNEMWVGAQDDGWGTGACFIEGCECEEFDSESMWQEVDKLRKKEV